MFLIFDNKWPRGVSLSGKVCVRSWILASCFFPCCLFVFSLNNYAGMTILDCKTDLVQATHSCDATGDSAGRRSLSLSRPWNFCCCHDSELAQHSSPQGNILYCDRAKATCQLTDFSNAADCNHALFTSSLAFSTLHTDEWKFWVNCQRASKHSGECWSCSSK